MPPKKDAKKSDKPVAKKKEGSGGGKAKKKVCIMILNGRIAGLARSKLFVTLS